MATIDEFIKANEITMEVIRVGELPGFVPYVEPFQRRPSGVMPTPAVEKDGDRDWQHFAWSATLSRGGVDLSTPFRSGIAHVTRTAKRSYYPDWGEFLPTYQPTPPTAADVLDSLANDASAWENSRSFENFASDLGYDPDSRKAEAIYRACGEIAKGLRNLLGAEGYEELLWKVERL